MRAREADSPVEHLREKEDAASQMVAIAMKEANTIVATRPGRTPT